MSEADTGDLEDEYTGGGGVRWVPLMKGIVGIVLTILGYAYASAIGLVRDGVTGALDGIGSWLASLVEAPFTAGEEEIVAAARTGGDALSWLGPAAFPVAVGIAVTTTLILLWGVSRYV